MKKLEALSEIFNHKSDVIIICNKEDECSIFDEIEETVENFEMNTEKNSNGFQTVKVKKTTFHFGDENALSMLIENNK